MSVSKRGAICTGEHTAKRFVVALNAARGAAVCVDKAVFDQFSDQSNMGDNGGRGELSRAPACQPALPAALDWFSYYHALHTEVAAYCLVSCVLTSVS